MFLFFYFFIFLFGLTIGSFLNVVIMRLETGESPAQGRSHCLRCNHALAWFDLIPLLSFAWLKGTCRYCRAGISWQYPLVEIATAAIFLLIFNFQLSIINQNFNYQIISIIFLWFIASCLVVIFTYDLKFFLIPDVVLFPAIIVTFLYRVFENLSHWSLIENWPLKIGNYLLAATIASGFFLIIYLISRGRWMGFGDVKLAILLGLLLGVPYILLALFLAFLFGAIIGVAGILLKKSGLKSEIPFAPFLIIGTGVALFWGKQIISWYMHFFIG